MDNITTTEAAKYKQIWSQKNYKSGNNLMFFYYLKNIIKNQVQNPSIVELGCGDASLYTLIKNDNFEANYLGIDITTAHLTPKQQMHVKESPIWETGLFENAAEVTCSCDVLEHLPPSMVEQSIKEILKITSHATFHAICTREATQTVNGENAHLTVQPLTWWAEQFEKHNTKGVKVYLTNSDQL
jgi:hypothetical protein